MPSPTDENSGGGSSQPDWNQTDEAAADFIKNKPFSLTETVLVEEQTFTPAADVATVMDVADTIVGGNVVRVVFDGVTYILDVIYQSLLDLTLFGNPSLAGFTENTGEPFVAFLDGSSGDLGFFVSDPSVDHTVAVYKQNITQIDARYVPIPQNKVQVYTNDAGKYLYTDVLCETKLTQAELIEIARSDATLEVVCEWGDSYRCYPVMVLTSPNATCGIVGITVLGNNLTAETKWLYTAEYSAEET